MRATTGGEYRRNGKKSAREDCDSVCAVIPTKRGNAMDIRGLSPASIERSAYQATVPSSPEGVCVAFRIRSVT